MACLKTEVEKLGIDKLVPVPSDLAKLSNAVKNNVVKKTEYTKLVKKVNSIDTTGFVLKTTYDTDKSDLEKKISDADKKILATCALVKKTDFNSKISGLVKKTDYKTKISEIENKVNDHNHDKYITTLEFNTMAASGFNARLAAQTDLIKKKTEFDFKLKGISDRVTKNKSKH